MEFEKHSLKHTSEVRTSLKVTQGIFALIHVANAVHTLSYTMFMVTWCSSECCVSSGLDLEAAGGSVARYCFSNYVFASRESSRCKHDMGLLLLHSKERSPCSLAGL